MAVWRYAAAPTTLQEDPPMAPKRKTSIVMDDKLLQRLKHRAVEERVDLSTLLAKAAEEYLGRRKKGGR